jgi:uncharacterized protein
MKQVIVKMNSSKVRTIHIQKFIFKTLSKLLLIAVLTSCSFNKPFYYPTKIENTTDHFTMNTFQEAVDVQVDLKNYQPISLKKGNDTLNLDFTIESVVFKSSNGNKLNGWLLKPKNQVPTITILHFHGSSRNIYFHHTAIAPLLKKGFQVFTFDYSGFGYSEGKATRKNILADGLSAVDYIKTRNEVKNTKLVIYGQSMGGHLAAVVGEKRQNDIDGLVIEGAFSSHKDIGDYSVRYFGKVFVKNGYSATKSIKDYHKPLLIIHSHEDRRVPFFMGQKLFENANEPKEFYEVDKYHIGALQFYSEEISTKIKKMVH